MNPSLQARPWSPVSERDRVFTLDALRGVAIFGVVAANVVTFAFPAWLPPSSSLAAGDVGSRLLVGLIVEGKFYVLFSILFGMGLALQFSRAAGSRASFGAVYLRRLGILFVLGLAHGVLLYSGDILAFYAVLGLVAMAVRGLSQRSLVTLAGALLLANVLAVGANAVLNPGSVMPAVPDWQELAEKRRAALGFPATGGIDEEGVEDDVRLAFPEVMGEEKRVFTSGTWWERTRHRAFAYIGVGWPMRMLFTSWRVLGLFVLGIYLVRRGVFLESGEFRRRYLKWLGAGLLIGLLMQAAGGAVQAMRPANVLLLMTGVLALLGGGVVHALAYASGVAWLCLYRGGQRLLRPVAAVGRMALTNYLLSSIVFGLVFYPHGLGLFDRLTTAQALGIAVALYVAELVVSSLWLRRFRFGPFEWLWRTLTYGRAQPFCRGGSATV